ncbi:9795_t:CDS:2 [Entrophospora sp. SA101]|nr:9791_t:CDS:2 [Entrophospora sp. SA101]CAJ0647934.1 9795_t:CDS:2 [Entrophospora sp. SA101]CAJ0856085.1 18601_t:CDS:2 [Entrophospora sp. SA101]CAJ0884192.1 6047_t:CDS:2 [Entrophospora sp. SA101]CAJ0893887.1 4096_t:CDS:2 [Entrophospora sp. SA101]
MPRPRKQEDSLGLVQWIVRTAVFCVFYVTTDKSAKDIIKITRNNSVKLELPERIILIANHQIYADWIYIWTFAYLANAHGAVKIILKDSLKWLPIFGW